MSRINLDMDVLRTLVAAHQLGGFKRAAEQIGRSHSAVSQQIRKLETQVGQKLFRKAGRGLVPTEAGEIILAYGRRILELNDEAVGALHDVETDGTVRFGLPGDFAESWLPAALGCFKRAHPSVRVEATLDGNKFLIERLDKGQLDFALVLGLRARPGAEVMATVPMAWIGGRAPVWKKGEPVPLAMFAPPCFFRAAAISALDAAGIPWRVEFTSPGLPGLWAAVDAGMGIAVRTAVSAPGHLKIISGRYGLPPLPSVDLSLDSAGRALTPAASRLRDVLLETLPPTLSTRDARKAPVQA
jgi:DNA-binding transcriptional LysR family regulator